MMNKLVSTGISVIIAVFLTGCATSGQRQGVGIVAGGVGGGYLGHVLTGGSTLGTVVGAAGGALIGNEVAKRTDPHKK